MGLPIDRVHFSPADYDRFADRLDASLPALRELLRRDGFGAGAASLGAELEVYIVDADGYPLPRNTEILARHADRHLSEELNRFNLEFDFDPLPAAGTPLSGFLADMTARLAALADSAAAEGGRIVPIGILPTLRASDFGPHVMSPGLRYEALMAGLKRLGDGKFRVNINGADPLRLDTEEITMEGATTSFQLHLKVPPGEFGATWNAAQLATPIVLALGANSPLLLGHRLWHETRVALFKQSVDPRSIDAGLWHAPARVSFGSGWLRGGADQLFEEAVRLHPPLLPLCSDEDALAVVRAGETPALHELRLHQGTVWSWNRPVYDPHAGGHVRIEFRSTPSGPTPVDMLAGAALMLGLTASLRADIERLLPALPFALADHNFYRAAQFGIHSPLIWPHTRGAGLRERPLLEVAADLLGRARDGLGALGVADSDTAMFLGVIRDRIDARRNGASWQLAAFEALRARTDRDTALRELVAAYCAEQAGGRPVHEWRCVS